ncbi:MAG TPA: hypothetical protein VFJ74_14400 [Gemmatimonadaceae bacterium]|nr:hypothetical protein [Gemmatimonadaceae bacterium]
MTHPLPAAATLLLLRQATAVAEHAATAAAGSTMLKTVAMYAVGAGVLLAAVGGAAWLGRRLRAELRRAPGRDDGDAVAGLGPSELTARHVFRTLQERNIASVEELAAMTPRERQLLFDAVATKVTPIVGMPAVRSAGGPTPSSGSAAVGRARQPSPPPPPAASGPLHCPACGAALAIDTDAPRSVTHCDGCGRRVATRRDGARLTVTVDDLLS